MMGEGFVGPKKKTIVGLLVFNPIRSLANTKILITGVDTKQPNILRMVFAYLFRDIYFMGFMDSQKFKL
jgi:hypothetical protein